MDIIPAFGAGVLGSSPSEGINEKGKSGFALFFLEKYSIIKLS